LIKLKLRRKKQLIRISNVRKTTKFKRSIKAISPVIATLLMIAIAVVASLVVYAWVTGYIGGTTSTAGKAIQIQSFATQGGNLMVYVQNVGQGDVQINQDQSVYVDSTLVTISGANPVPTQWPLTLPVGQTVELTVPLPSGYTQGDKLNIKVTTTDGTFMTTTGKPSSGGTPIPAVPTIVLNPITGPAATTVTVTGTGFAATSAMNIKFNAVTQTTVPATVTTSAAGAFSCTFNVPSIAAGPYTVLATDASSGSDSDTFTVTTPVQYTITFASSGLGGDGSGNLVTYSINGGSQTSIGVAGGSITVNTGSSVTYTFQSPIASSGSPSTTRYLWSSTSGLSQTTQTGTFTVSATGTITATYTTQTFGVDTSNTGSANSGTTVSVTLSNCKANDLIIVFGSANGNLASGVTDDRGTGNHLNWAQRGTVDQSSHQRISEWSAVFTAGGTITITMTFTADATNGFSVVAFAISGANTATPFDTHSGLPYSAYSSNTNTAPSVTGVLTTNANDMIIGLAGSRTATTETAGTGFTLIKSITSAGGSGAAEDEILTSPLSSSTTVSFGTSISTSTWAMIVDAVQRAW